MTTDYVSSPSAAMERVHDLLRPGGWVYVETPNVASYGFSRYRDRWYPLEAPRHLWLFSPATLTRLVAESGLATESVVTTTYITPQWAAAFREADRTGVGSAEHPVVPPRERLRVAMESAANRWHRMRDRTSGDIVGLWAQRLP